MIRYRIFFLLIVLFAVVPETEAQETEIYRSEITSYRKAQELFDKQKFGAAKRHFEKAVRKISDPSSEITMNAEYYAALCAVELFNRDAEHLMKQFIANYPSSPYIKSAYFQLGKYNFQKRKWKKVIRWLTEVDMFDLDNQKLPEYYFKLGYAYFQEEDYQNAGKMFYEIKDVDNEYAALAKYYHGHISYEEKNFETALQDFLKLVDDDKFSRIVPYYIAQIYYLQEKYETLLDYAPALLDSANPKRAPEISRLIGESYYHLGKFGEAVPYLEAYSKKFHNVSREDKYQLAYAYYRSAAYDEAAKLFSQLSTEKDPIAQNSFYHLGAAYLKQGNKKYAINAFQSAAEFEFDKKIQEESMFTYAKLAYEVSFDPYFKAANAFWDYLDTYPESEMRDEALGYLVNLYMTSRNYKAAMISLEAVKEPDYRLQQAHQKVAYNLGVEHFLNGYYQASVNNFKKTRIYPIKKELSTLSFYWAGEAYYKLRDYDNAIKSWKRFLFEPRAILQPEYPIAHYNIAYAYFKKQDYPSAVLWFRKYAANKDATDSVKINDAYLRVGDAYFVSKRYSDAVEYYNRAIDAAKMDTDYALYQKAIALGILQKNKEKIATLKKLVSGFPGSGYLADAKYALGKSYMLKDSTATALGYFDQVINEFPNSSYVKKALLNKGLIHYNNKKNQEALAIFRQIVEDYPNYEDSREALLSIRNIYVDIGKVDEYEEYITGLDFVNITESSLDSTNYEAAYLQYADGNCDNAEQSFKRYLEKFKPGIYALNAQFYRAECLIKQGKTKEALEGYQYVISQPLNKFTENALVKAADINYSFGNYQDALTQYMMLENIADYKTNLLTARIGQMRCFYHIKNFAPSVEYAQKVLKDYKLPKNIVVEANLTIGKAAVKLEKDSMALEAFGKTAGLTKSEMGAEAKYNIALILYNQGHADSAEATVFELVNAVPAYEQWIAKGLILLADIYRDKGDLFQAKATLQSIVENYKEDDLKEVAQEKINKIIELEKANAKNDVEQPEDMEIIFDENGKLQEEQEEDINEQNKQQSDTLKTKIDSSQTEQPNNVNEEKIDDNE